MPKVEGLAADWLAARRDELNARFRQARKRFGRLDGERVLELAAEVLPPLAGAGEPGTADLLAAVYDLILLHAGRGLLAAGPQQAGDGGGRSWADLLLRETFVKLRPLLLMRPRQLPAALSNAAESFGVRGAEFARELATVGTGLENPQELLDAAAVLAWRLGEARLREAALRIAATLPPRTVLAALGLSDWHPEAAPLVLAALSADAWRHPRNQIRPETVARVGTLQPEERAALYARLAAPADSGRGWQLAAAVENFSGFGGHLDAPPVLLDSRGVASRHRFWVLTTTGIFRLEADTFGCVCQSNPYTDYPVQAVATRGKAVLAFLTGQKDQPRLYADGRLEGGGRAEQVPDAAGAVSYRLAPGLIAFTRADSFRVRVLVPAREPL
jgi:hypothetical protein